MRSTGLLMTISILLCTALVATPGCGREQKPAPAPPPKESDPGLVFTPPEERAKPAKAVIGVLAPLSGQKRAEGEAFVEGLKIALAEKAGATGLTEKDIAVADTGVPGAHALSLAKDLLDNRGVCILAGPMTEQNVNDIDELTRHNELIVLTPVSGPLRLSMLGSTVVRLTLDDTQEGAAAATFAVNMLSAKSAAVLVDSDLPASERRAIGFAKEFAALGGAAPGFYAYSKDARNFRRTLRMIAQEKPDVIYLPGKGDDAVKVLGVIRDEQIPARVIGSTDWDIRGEFGAEAGPVSGIYAIARFTPDRTGPATRGFVVAYTRRHPGETPTAFHALGYDAGLVIIEAVRSGGKTCTGVRAAIEKLQDIKGATGPLSFADGTLVTRVPVLRLKEKAFVFEKMTPVK